MAEDFFANFPVCRVTIPTLPVVFAEEINLNKTDIEDSTTPSKTWLAFGSLTALNQ